MFCSRGVESLKVGYSDGHGVRGVGRGRLTHPQQYSHHKSDLAFVRRPTADNRLLHATGRVFMHRQAASDRCQNHGAARRSERDGRLIALDEDDSLDGHRLRFMPLDDIGKALVKREQAAGGPHLRAISKNPEGDAMKILIFPAKHCVAGGAQRRVNGHNRFG